MFWNKIKYNITPAKIIFYVITIIVISIFLFLLIQASWSFVHFIDNDNKYRNDTIFYNVNRYALDVYHYDFSSPPSNEIIDNQDIFIQKLDSITKLLKEQNQDILQRQDNIIADIRQETNNNLDKISAWLAFWIGIMAILGVFVPFAFQYFVYKRDFAKLKEIETKSQMLANEQFIKLMTRCIDDLNTHNCVESTEQKAKTFNLSIEQIKHHLHQLHPLDKITPQDEEISLTKARLISIGIILWSTLNNLIRKADFIEIINIQIAQDKIRTIVKGLCDLDEKADSQQLYDFAQRLSTSFDAVYFNEKTNPNKP